ncbi:MAG: hypothetical protein HY299_12390 [Verrucomicrobia bacterium]|nr:hypothetical protein [Verrucomicrobiota bacterium]
MKPIFVIGAVVTLGIAALVVSQKVRTTASHVTAGKTVGIPSAAGAAPGSPTTVARRLFSYDKTNPPPLLTLAQAEAFVEQHQRKPEALLAAYQASLDESFLREALEKHPQDPRVALAAAVNGGPDPKHVRQAPSNRTSLDTFKRSAPDNALADYLSARDHFRMGQASLAVKECLAADAKSMQDYSLDKAQNTEAAYRSAGYSEAESKAISETTLLMPHIAPLRELARDLTTAATTHRQRGDEASAQKLLRTAMSIGSRLDAPGALTLLQSIVGVAVQLDVLQSLDPAATLPDSGVTVQAQIGHLRQRREAIQAASRQFHALLEVMSDEDTIAYFERLKKLGEEAAMLWVITNHPTQ